MNTGAEAVETAVKVVRRWAYRCKGVPENQAEIIVCSGNFHGRTLTVTSFSSSAEYKKILGRSHLDSGLFPMEILKR